MAITKTGITLTSGGRSQNFERNGQQSYVTADGLSANTTYTAQAYVKEDNGRTTTSSTTTQFTTLQAGSANLANRSAWNGSDVDIRYEFGLTYPIDGVKILNDKSKDFEDPVVYTPIVTGTYNGTFTVTINDPMTYVLVMVIDMYGEEFQDIFDINDLP